MNADAKESPCEEASKMCASRQEVMETVILEKTIIKLFVCTQILLSSSAECKHTYAFDPRLGSLLALGFGEAGADIIGRRPCLIFFAVPSLPSSHPGKNMSGSDSAGVNAMVPGRKCEPHSSVLLS